MPASPIARLRRLCLALPEAVEVETWETPTFRVRGRIFALVGSHGDAPAVWLKAPPGAQELLLAVDPARFFRPPYLGGRGWIGVVLSGSTDWAEVDALVRRSFSLIAPRRVAARVATPDAPAPATRRGAGSR
ncbi:MmcQ/YjbR family DNA-binding protein, partial [Falsiroseomonas oryzae]|uniref:MmcQ/YjbR family DNA-binding protein n=1 Tax=Falsiroseomonas oryzae TaxID=2766473 RepID=UPI0022EB92FF